MIFSTIGTSWITQKFIEAANASGKAYLHSIYSRSPQKAQQFAENNGAMKRFTDIDEMLQEPIDFIYIASPNTLHYEHIRKSIAQGKHVFCEKPLVYTEQQWKTLKEEAHKKGVFLFEGLRHLFTPNYYTLKAALSKAGQIRSAILQYVQYSSRYDEFKKGTIPNIFSKEFAGGALMDLGIYPLSMAIDLFGEPFDIAYFPVKLSNGIDGSGTLIAMYPDFNVTIMCSKIAQATIPSEIHGEDGTLTIDHLAPINTVHFYDRKTKKTEILTDSSTELDMVYEVESFVKIIEENDKRYHDELLERSGLVVKFLEIARKKERIFFTDEN
ncbi:Gfo/Idh/MocA family protein [Oceanobacillus polygoni]|uniref:Dehydrogenase n=1 Tax=Oceanobacillus polygoni TaxID=1235259 RepID=A0A9X0YTR2_9BACI|nr:Gfo/Idh/MocA family oxidoreductase [Oceanobacillus polygoni]MBP2078469.1 putative dehydrogenase [Oceanobacillus polygoni]